MAPRIPQQRVAESLADELRRRILAGADELPAQDELVRDFGVSHPSVREAIRILETEGLVTVRRGNVGGLEVHRPDEASSAYHLGLALQGGRVSLADLAAGLQLFEPLCAAECARRPDRAKTVVPALQENIDESAGLVGAGPAFTHVARQFHDRVVSSTPNVTMRYVVGSLVTLWSAQEAAWANSLSSSDDYATDVDAKSVLKAHQRITDEIAAGRPAQAEKAARSHLIASQAFLVERLGNLLVTAPSSPRPRGWSDR